MATKCKRTNQTWRAIAERFMKYVDKRGPDECWPWTGYIEKSGRAEGYAKFQVSTHWSEWAHRVSYMLFVRRRIPHGCVIDHVKERGCHSRACVNPNHLEAITQQQNTLRGNGPSAMNAKKTHCPAGHPYDDANTFFGREKHDRKCRICQNDQSRLRNRRYRAEARKRGVTLPTDIKKKRKA